MPGLSELTYISPGTAAFLPKLPYPFSMKSHFSNNAQVYYKPGSLSVSSGGSVVNARRKAQRV